MERETLVLSVSRRGRNQRIRKMRKWWRVMLLTLLLPRRSALHRLWSLWMNKNQLGRTRKITHLVDPPGGGHWSRLQQNSRKKSAIFRPFFICVKRGVRNILFWLLMITFFAQQLGLYAIFCRLRNTFICWLGGNRSFRKRDGC